MDSAPAPPTPPKQSAHSTALVSLARLFLSFTDWLLRRLHIDPPEANNDRRRDVVKALRKLWVAGALGAFFTALSRNLPVDLAWPSPPIDWTLTSRQILRYGYLLWLLFYFLISSVGIERLSATMPKPTAHAVLKDILFDVLQSFLALLAAYFLRFIQPGAAAGKYDLAYPNFAILAICVVSWLMFPLGQRGGVHDLRLLGGFLAVVSFILTLVGMPMAMPPLVLHCVLLFFLFLYFLILFMYFRIRLDGDESALTQAEVTE